MSDKLFTYHISLITEEKDYAYRKGSQFEE